MGKGNFSDDFKRDAVAQITERGYPVAEVSERWASALIRCTSGRSGLGGRVRETPGRMPRSGFCRRNCSASPRSATS